MITNITSSTTSSVIETASQTNTQKLNQKFEKQRLLETVETISIAGSFIGSVVALVSQQVFFASVPFSLSLCINQINRRRLTYQVQQNYAAVLKTTDLDYADTETLEKKLESFESIMAQIQQNMLPRQNLAPVVSKLQQLSKQQLILEKTLSCQAQFPHDYTAIEKRIQDLESMQLLTVQTMVKTLTQPTAAQKCDRKRGRVAIFIDGANLYHAAKEQKVEIDYAKLLTQLAKDASSLVGVYFYTGIDRNNQNQQSFLSYLRSIGYQIIHKNMVQRADGSKKGNMDIELALDMVALVDRYDTAVLVSGDGDFTCVVNLVKQSQARVEVVSFRKATSPMLIDASDSYINLVSLQTEICKVYPQSVQRSSVNNSVYIKKKLSVCTAQLN